MADAKPTEYKIEAGSVRVQDIPVRQQPRELFDRLGAEHVPDDVLLAIVLRSGIPKLNVLQLANGILSEYGSLTGVAKASVDELAAIRGMGKVKAQVVKASLELAKRLAEEQTPESCAIHTPEDAVALLRERARSREEEAFWIILLDSKNRLKRPPVEITKGILDASLIHPREVFKEAIRSASAAIVLAHNHPSGDPSPSAEDIQVTKKLVASGNLIEIPVMDHVILGSQSGPNGLDFFSFRESGLVQF